MNSVRIFVQKYITVKGNPYVSIYFFKATHPLSVTWVVRKSWTDPDYRKTYILFIVIYKMSFIDVMAQSAENTLVSEIVVKESLISAGYKKTTQIYVVNPF